MKKRAASPRLSLQAILLIVCLLMLTLPLVGIYFLKIYESALVRQTESELISQAAFISATYKNEVRHLLAERGIPSSKYGRAIKFPSPSAYYQPIPASIDLSRDPILPTRPDGLKTGHPADAIAQRAGREILPVLKDAQRVTLAGMKILDSEGVVISGQQEVGLSFIRIDEVKRALWGQPVSVIRKRPRGYFEKPPPLSSISRGADINVFVSLPIILDNRVIGVAYVNRTPSDLVKALYNKKEDIIFACVVVLLVTLGIAAFASYTITRPIYALIEQAKRISEGDKAAVAPIESPVTKEIATLSENFSTMARTIEHRSEYIRNFAMQVSHEFKTPLTSIQGSIELLQDHGDSMPAEQKQRFLANIAEDTDRLKRLVSRLLELARADVSEPVPQATKVFPILQKAAERYKDYRLEVQLSGDRQTEVSVSEETLETVLSNLLDNSAQHGAKIVKIEVRRAGDDYELLVQDDGEGISAANTGRIFTPFFTTKRARGGTGLGLSITQSLLHAQKGDIENRPSQTGAVFVVRLPASDSGN